MTAGATLQPGESLGPYRIVSFLAAGGMGAVYRAHDPRTGRDVAIKVAAQRFSDRFAREVRAVASLNHPNVCTLYDVGDDYLVMELVEGPTLADRIASRALPLEDAIPIARQIASALEAAHDRHIVHRDLKPGNVKLTPDGNVKVLDFGLAQVNDPPDGTVSQSPTFAGTATGTGMILGTAAYMSPEQARGRPVDKRADIWAFGVVLYEMLAGRPLFQADNISDTIAAVLTKEPDWTRVPAQAETLLRRCLQRDPARRLRDIGDALPLIEHPSVAPRLSRAWAPWVAAVALLIALSATSWKLWQATRPIQRAAMQFEIELGSRVRLPPPSFNPSVVLSRDGRYIAFLASTGDGPTRIHVRRVDQATATELMGTEGATAPVFSPSGEWIAFVADGSLRKIPALGGSVIDLLPDMRTFAGARWLDDRNLIIGTAVVGGLLRVPADGGKPETVLPLRQGELAFRFPEPLPDGDTILFVSPDMKSGSTNIEAYSIAKKRRTVVTQGTTPKYMASGHLLYVDRGTLFAVPFDAKTLQTTGTPVPMVSGIAMTTTFGGADFDVTAGGMLVYRAGPLSGAGATRVMLTDASGSRVDIKLRPGAYNNPRFSPDGGRIAFSSAVPTNGLTVYDVQRETSTPLEFRELVSGPVWTDDGRFLLTGTLTGRLMWMPSDGSAAPQSLVETKQPVSLWSFANDRIAYSTVGANGSASQVWTLAVRIGNGRITAGGAPELFIDGGWPALHPGGKLMAYATRPANGEIQVRPFPSPSAGQTGLWPISSGGGEYPIWFKNDLLYQAGDRVMAVAYRIEGDVFVPSKPREWRPGLRLARSQWSISPDGQQIVTIAAALDTQPPPSQEHTATLVLNFQDELRRRIAPAR
jgi:serine/threonine-protein kinase